MDLQEEVNLIVEQIQDEVEGMREVLESVQNALNEFDKYCKEKDKKINLMEARWRALLQ